MFWRGTSGSSRPSVCCSTAPFAGNLIFKGGTSPSKVWHAIRRGMLLDENEPLDALMERCAAIEARANALRPRDS